MRLVFAILISFSSYGQLSIGLTAQKQFERTPGDLSDGILPTFNESLINDYYGIHGEYKTYNFVFGLGLSYLYKNYHLAEEVHDIAHYTYSADIESSSLGIRLNAGYSFFNSWFNLVPSVYLQSDLLLSEVESNHYSSYWYTAYSPGGAPYTYGDFSEEEFDAVEIEPNHWMTGFSLESRFNIDRVYFSFFFDAGYTSRRKRIANPEFLQNGPVYNEEGLIRYGSAYYGYGLKIGYQFGVKDDTVITHPPM